MDVIFSSVLQVHPVTGAPLVLAAYRPNRTRIQWSRSAFPPLCGCPLPRNGLKGKTLGAISKPVKR